MTKQEREAAKQRKYNLQLAAYLRDRLARGGLRPHMVELFERRIPILEEKCAP